MAKVKTIGIYTGVALIWIGGFYLAAKGGQYVGEGVGRACSKLTEKLVAKL